MPVTRRQYQVYIDRPPQAVFDFHADLANHPRTCPPEQNEQVLQGLDKPLKAGAQVAFRSRHGFFTYTLKAEITHFHPPDGFTSRQVRGPFAEWTHRHKFAPLNKGTLLTEQIEYRAPFGPLGRIVDKLWLGKHLDRFFTYRHESAKRLLEWRKSGRE